MPDHRKRPRDPTQLDAVLGDFAVAGSSASTSRGRSFRPVGRSFAGTFQAVAALAMRIFSRLRARKPLLLVVAGNR